MPDYTPIPVGIDIQVNTFTAGEQSRSSVTALADGGFVVTWSSSLQDGSGFGVYGQRFDSEGVAQGEEFRVNTYTAADQYYPGAAALVDGGFVVTWTSYGQDGSYHGIYGRRYDPAGVALGEEFRVNTYTAGSQSYSTVSALADGGFVVTWTSYEQDNSTGVYGQRYDPAGVALGEEFRVNTDSTADRSHSNVAALADGGFVVTWSSSGQDGSGWGVYAQRYDPEGVAQGEEFRVNTYTADNQRYSSVTALAGGGFVITWASLGQDSASYDIYGQRYDSEGVAQGEEFRVNTYTAADQVFSSMTALADGGFVVTWTSYGQDGSEHGVYGQHYDSAGVALGSEFRLNDITLGSQLTDEYSRTTVSTLADGRLVATWVGAAPGEWGEVFTRIITVPPTTTAIITAVTDDVGAITGALHSGSVTDDTSLTLAGAISDTLNLGEIVAIYDGSIRLGAATVIGTNWTYTDNTLAPGDAVNYTAAVEDSLGNQGAPSAAIVITIDIPPIAAHPITNQYATEDSMFSFVFAATTFADPDVGDTLAYTATLVDGSALPTWLSFNAETRTFSGMPDNDNVGTLTVKVTATDIAGAAVSDEFDITVANTNDAPTLANAVADQSASEFGYFSFQVPSNTFSDVDAGDTLTYSATLSDGNALPSWLSFNASTRTFTGTPLSGDAGTISVRVTAIDSGNASVSDIFDFVVDANDAPEITSNGGLSTAAISVAENSQAVTAVTVFDPDYGASPTFSIVGGADSSQFQIDPATGVLTFVTAPDFEAPTDFNSDNAYDVVVEVFDGELFDTQSITVSVTDVGPSIISGDGNANVIIGTAEEDELYGLGGNDILHGSRANDQLFGADGDDLLDGGAGSDLLDGGSGFDTADYSSASAGLIVNLANNSQNTGEASGDSYISVENVIGSNHNDTIIGSAIANYLGGLGGDDVLDGAAGNDILSGGSGNDTLNGGADSDTASYADIASGVTVSLRTTASQNTGGGGTDQLISIENLIGSSFNDTLTSDSTTANILRGGQGNDRYYIYEAQDQALEEAGEGTADRVEALANVTLSASSEIETIVARLTSGMTLGGSDTANRIDGNTGNDTLNGNGGNDTLYGLAGNDTLNGGSGNDTLEGGAGNDVMNGGADEDTASYAAATSAVNVSLLSAAGQNTLGAGTDTLTNIENLIGSAFGDTLNGNNSTNTLTGGAGNDILNGRGGLNTLSGGSGNDLYYVNATTDIIVEASNGGARDVIYAFSDYTLEAGVYVEQIVARLTTGQTLTGNELNNILQGNTGSDTLIGGAGNDTLDGRAGADVLSGGTGNDKYYVDAADDVVNEAAGAGTLDIVYASVDYALAAGQEIERLYSYGSNTGLALTGNELTNFIAGGAGNDTLIGGAGSDRMYSHAGDDRLVGGTGRDTLFGNSGSDVFVLQNLAMDRDVIRDFEAADQLEVSASVFGGGLAAGALGANQFTSNGTGVATTADQRFIYNTSNGALYFDIDGNGASARVQIASLTGIPGLSAADFNVVY